MFFNGFLDPPQFGSNEPLRDCRAAVLEQLLQENNNVVSKKNETVHRNPTE